MENKGNTNWIQSLFFIFFASMITTGIAYITTPLYTRLLSPSEFGQVSIFNTWKSTFGIIAMFCLSYGVFNNGMLDYKEKRDDYTFSMLMLSNLISLVFTIIIILLYPFIEKILNIELPLLYLMLLLFFIQPAYNFWVSRQRFEYKYKALTKVSIISAFLSPLVSIVCILNTNGSKLNARLFGGELTLISIYIVFYIYIIFKGNFKINFSYWKYAVIFNLPLIPHYLSSFLLAGSDKLMISYLVNDSATAYYSVAYSVAAIAIIIWSAANASLIPYTYENCEKKNYAAISKVTMPLLIIFAIVSFLIIILAPEIVAVIATKDYREAIYVIPPIVGGVFFQVQYFIYANIIYYYKKPKYVMYASVFSMVLNIFLNYIFIQRFGYLAAGYTTLVCYFFQAVLDYFAMKKVVHENVYNMKFISLLSAIVIIVALLSNFIYNFVIIRYLILLFTIVVCLINKNKIMNSIKALKNT